MPHFNLPQLDDFQAETGNEPLWMRDAYLRAAASSLTNIRLLSLDVFDTLLLRSCAEPADLFEELAVRAHSLSLLKCHVTAAEFKQLRIRAERLARERMLAVSGHTEVTLRHIYDELPASLCDRRAMHGLELELEKQWCYLNPNIASLLVSCKSRGIRIALVSDMYMTAEELVSILTRNGLDISQIDAVLVSSEQDGSKANGHLFDKLLATFPDVAVSDVLHIGDSSWADIGGAGTRQIPSLYYPVVPETFESPYHWETVRHGSALPALRSLRKLAAITGPAGEMQDDERFFFRLGAGFIGPFLHGLCEWAIDTCVRENLSEVHPLMREAHTLAPMLERIIKRRGLAIEVKPLYVSRQALYLPSLSTFGEKEVESLLGSSHLTIAGLFDTLLLDKVPEPFLQYADYTLEACESAADHETGRNVAEELRKYLLDDRTRLAVEQSAGKQRALFLDYIGKQCGSPDRLLTVDIGFHGTIQSSINRAYEIAGADQHHIHLLAVGTSSIIDKRLRGADMRCFVGSSGGDNGDMAAAIARSPAFLEELMMGEFGTTMRYERNTANETVQPVTARLVHSADQFRFKSACQQGIRSFQQLYGYWLACSPELVSAETFPPREWTKPLHRLIDMPTPEEAQRLGDLTHQDNYKGEQTIRICEPVDVRWFSQGIMKFLDFGSFGPNVVNVFWPQGMATRQSPYALYELHARLLDSFGRGALWLSLVQLLKEAGRRRFHVYGRSQEAAAFARLSEFHGLSPVTVIDHDAGLRQIMAALESGPHIYALASLSEFAEFKALIEAVYREAGKGGAPLIVHPQPPV